MLIHKDNQSIDTKVKIEYTNLMQLRNNMDSNGDALALKLMRYGK